LKNEYSVSTTLIILGDDLDPEFITQKIGLEPDKSWKRNEKEIIGSIISKHKWGGWKKFIDKDLLNLNIVEQLNYWASILKDKGKHIKKYTNLNYECYIDCFIQPNDGLATILLDHELIAKLENIGLSICLKYNDF